jgi:glycosyltransferase involved in cell wall biosynthesis
LQVINGLGTGGAERSLAESLPFFAAAGIKLIIACQFKRREGVEEYVRSQSHDVRFLLQGNLPGRVRALRSLIRSERVNLVHTTIFESDLLGRLAAVGCGIPVLTSLVNTPYEPVRLTDPNVSRMRLWGARKIDGWTGRHLTSHFHAITQAVKASAVERLRVPAELITVIERGRDPSRLGVASQERRALARRELGLDDRDKVLVNVGRQEYQKGQRFLLEATAQLVPKHPRLKLVIAGRPGNASTELHRALDQLGIEERVKFLGHREDVPEILAAGDVFVFPSLYEGLGGSLIEAMALGLPIVASDIPAVREVLEENRNALLVSPASPEELAFSITRVLEDHELARRFRQRSVEIFHERFTLDKSAARMIQLYSWMVTGTEVPYPDVQ